LLVANGADSAFAIACHQVRIYPFHILGDETELWQARGINLLFVPKAYRPERQDELAGITHRLDLLLEPRRGGHRTQLAVSIHKNRSATRSRCTTDSPDKGVGNIRIPDPDGVALARHTGNIVADIDIVIACVQIGPGQAPQGDVVAARRVVKQRGMTGSTVTTARGVVCERIKACCRVEAAGGVGEKRAITDGRVLGAFGIAEEGERPIGGIVAGSGVTQKRPGSCGRIVCSDAGKERPSANACVVTSVS
jgi:hypothetical protein